MMERRDRYQRIALWLSQATQDLMRAATAKDAAWELADITNCLAQISQADEEGHALREELRGVRKGENA